MVVACGGDDSAPGGTPLTAGSGGTGASGGKAGASGANGAGSAGAPGVAGASAGGTAGSGLGDAGKGGGDTAGLACVAKISASQETLLALTRDGTVWTWGNNVDGGLGLEVGYEDTSFVTNPKPMPGLAGAAVDIATRTSGGCLVGKDHALSCWGKNSYGQVGAGSSADVILARTPITPLGTDVAQIAGNGLSACAVRADGSLWCWGSNTNGRLGVGKSDQQLPFANAPMKVEALGTNVAEVLLGNFSTCAALKDGTLMCWGDKSYTGLGNLKEDPLLPTKVAGLPAAVAHLGTAAYSNMCATLVDGSLWCWGVSWGRLVKEGTQNYDHVPIAVPGAGWKLVASGSGDWAVDTAGKLWYWNHKKIDEVVVPKVVAGVGGPVAGVTAGSLQGTFVTLEDGTLLSFGTGAGFGADSADTLPSPKVLGKACPQ